MTTTTQHSADSATDIEMYEAIARKVLRLSAAVIDAADAWREKTQTVSRSVGSRLPAPRWRPS